MSKRARVTDERWSLHDPRRFRAVFASNVLPVVVWHQDGRIRDANDAYLDLIGYSREDLTKGEIRCSKLTAPEHLSRDEHAIAELQSGKALCTLFRKDYICRRRGRVPVLLGGALIPNRLDEGIAFALDLTQYSSADNALRTHKELIHDLCGFVMGRDRVPDLEKLTTAKQSAWSLSDAPEAGMVLAHELSQPLGTILANAQAARRLLRQPAPNLENLKAIVHDIITEDRRASQLIARIRLLGKRNKGAIRLLNVNQLLGEVIHTLRAQFSTAAVEIHVALASDLPPVSGDRVQLHQLFINLLLNACEALKQIAPPFRKLFIRTRLGTEPAVSIEIEDTGPGIPADHLKTIFEPFVSSKSGSMGIGLYICRTIVESHAGSLWATNNPDGGATFHVRLPPVAPKYDP